MNDQLTKDDLVELFDAQTRAVPASPVPTDAIMGHGRSLKRRRGAVLVAATLVALGGTGVAVRSALRNDSPQLAVTDAANTTAAAQAAATSSPPPVGTPSSAAVAPSNLADGETIMIDELTVDQRLGLNSAPQPFRDGFLLPVPVAHPVPVSHEDGDHFRETLSFLFTVDGTEYRQLGTDLTVNVDLGSAVVVTSPDGSSVSVVAVTVDSSAEVHHYRTTDFVSWTDQVLDVDFDTDVDLGLSPALRRVVTPVPFVESAAISDDRLVFSADMVLIPSKAILAEYGVPNGSTTLEERGLVDHSGAASDEFGEVEVGEVKASPEQLGLSPADLELLRKAELEPEGPWLVSVGEGGPLAVTAVDGAASHQVYSAFGSSFVHIENPVTGDSSDVLEPIGANIAISSDGVSWDSFKPEIGPDEDVVSVDPLAGDALLVVTTTGTEIKSYRVDAALTAELLGQKPIPAGYTALAGLGSRLLRLWPTEDPLFVGDAEGGGSVTMPVGEFDVTIDLPTDEQPTVHYVIVRRDTGEVVNENVVGDPDFVEGEEIDGEQAIRFIDASGRPEIVISMDDLILGSVPPDDPNIDLMTTDGGVTWHEIPKKANHSTPLAVNGNKVLVEVDDDGVVEEGEVDFEVYELPR